MLIISFSQYEWANIVTNVPNKIIIDDILTPFVVISNTHIIDVLIKKVLTNSPIYSSLKKTLIVLIS